MKKLMFCFFLLSCTFTFAQDDVEVQGNTVTVREKAPIWPGCESSGNQKNCFNQKLMEHVKNNYKYPRNKDGEFVRGKVVVKMHIDEEGNTVITSVKGDQKLVIAAVENMLNKIPEMKPGTLAGKPVKISYTLPLNL
jgi:hypothetical protein